MSDPELGARVHARLEPWIGMVSEKLRALLAGRTLDSLLPVDDLAFAIVALYLGADMLGSLAGEHARAESLLDVAERFAPIIGTLSQQLAGSERVPPGS